MVKFLKITLFLSLGCFLLMALTPLILSSEWGKKKCIQAINYFSEGKVEIESFKLTWLSSQNIQNISWKSNHDTSSFTCQEIKTDAPLWKILFQQDVENLVLSHPTVSFQEKSVAKENRKEALRPRFSNETPQNKDHFSFPRFLIRRGNLTVEEGKGSFKNLHLEEVHLKLVIKEKEEILLDLSGKTLDPKVTGTFHLAGTFQDKENFKGKAKIINCPLNILESYLPPPLSQELFSADIEIQTTPQNVEFSIDANSSQFSAYAKIETKEGVISLKTPALVTWQIPPGVMPELPQSVNATLRINELSFPLGNKEALQFQTDLALSNGIFCSLSTQNLKEGVFSLSLYSPLVSFENAVFVKNETLSLKSPISLFGKIEGELSSLVIPPQWEDLSLEGEFILSCFNQEKVTTKVGVNTLKDVLLTLKGVDFYCSLQGEIDAKNKLFCSTQESRVSYLLPEKLSSLKEPLPLHIELDSFVFPLAKDNLSAIYAKGNVHTPQIHFHSFLFEKPSLQFEIEKEMATLLLKSQIEGGYLTLETSLFSIFNNPLETFIFHLQADSDILNADLHLKKEKESLTLLRPTKIEYLLTKHPTIELKEESKLFFELTKLHLPSLSSPAFEIQGDFLIDKLSFKTHPVTLNHLKLHVEKPSSQLPLSFQLNGTTSGKGLILSQGSFDPFSGSLDANFSLQNLPSLFLDLFTTTELLPSSVLGPTINLSLSTQLKAWEGDVKLNLNSLHTRVALDGHLQNRYFSLNDTLYAQFELTPQLSKLLFKETPLYSEFPLTLEIPKEGLSFSLFPFNYSQLQVPKIYLELGKIRCPNKGNVSLLLSLLKLSTFSQEKEVQLWFSPLELSISSGIVSLGRVDVLIENKYQVCEWGEYNLMKNKLHLNLGLTAHCLQKAFKIHSLPEDYVLQIPLKGNFQNLRIDKTKATSKVAQLLLFKQQATSKDGLPSLLGEFLGKTSLLPDIDFKIPPAKKPLPWETEEKVSHQTKELLEEKKIKKEFSPEEKPLKQILKMLR